MTAFAPITRLSDDRGAVALIAAISMTMIMSLAALSVDLGSLYLAKRQLQAATDMAALSATYAFSQANPTTAATALANRYMASNINGAKQITAITGIYCPDSSILAPSARFTPNGVSCANNADLNASNAVKVTANIVSPLYFGRVLMPGVTSETLSATATAAQINEAGFYIGSGLLSVSTMNNAILNALLPGSNINLASYNGLVNTNINALTFLNALATNLNVTAGTYGNLLTSSVSVQQVLQAEITVLNTPGSIVGTSAYLSQALSELGQLQTSIAGSPQVQLGSLFDLGVWQDVPVGSANATTALYAGLNVYQLASLTAQVANGSNAVSISNVSTGIPGIATLSGATTLIEPQQGPAFVFTPVDPTGNTIVHTSQVRLSLNLQIGQILGGIVNLPIYIEIANGNAKLTGISCGFNPASDATVSISAESGVADAYIGTVNPGAMTSFSTIPSVQSAQILNVAGLVTVTDSAHINVGNSGYVNLTYYQPNNGIQSPTTGPIGSTLTVSSTGALSNLLQSLGNTTPTVTPALSILGIPLISTSAVLALLNPLLQPVFASLDTLVDGILAALGIKIGYLDVTATGVRCGVPTLVY